MKGFIPGHRRRQGWRIRWLALPALARHLVTAVFALLLLAFVLAVLFRGRMSTWLWPDSRSEELRMQADIALQAGRLTASDGSGARELFQAALALQPDQMQARDGLARVALAALARAGGEIDRGRYAAARADLQLARALDAPRDRVQAVQASLLAREGSAAGVDGLLARAAAARAAGRLDQDEDAALPLYQRVLVLQPRNQRAVEGREDALTDLLFPARAAILRGDAARAASLLQRARRFDPGHVELPALQAGLAQLRERDTGRVRLLVAAGSVQRAAAICIRWQGAGVEAGMPPECTADVVDGLLAGSMRLAADFDVAGSEKLLATARLLAAGDARIRQAERRLAQARRGAATLPQARRPTRRELAKVRVLLAEAAQAQARGDWITPPGDSVWDKLRDARSLAPDDPRVRRALAALEPAARRCQSGALRDNRLRDARACLDVWRQLDPDDADLPAATRRLAQRWIAIGDQRLERSEIDAAAQAAEQARGLDAATPGLQELAQRVLRAQPGKSD